MRRGTDSPTGIVFEKDEPFCFITLGEYRALDDVTPEIIPLKENPELATQFKAYRDARKNFIGALDERDPAAVKQGWQNGICGEKIRLARSEIRPTPRNSVLPGRSSGHRPVPTQWPKPLKKRGPDDVLRHQASGPSWPIPALPAGKS
jgi:hypothetical protein